MHERAADTVCAMMLTTIERSARAARLVFAGAIAALGIIHVIAGEAVTRLFPVWPISLPGRPWWAHVAGALLLVLGAMILFRRSARTAATLTGLVILASVICLHLPRSLRSDNFGDEWLNVFKWLAMAAAAFVVADSFPPAPKRTWSAGLIAVFSKAARWLLAAFMLGAAVIHVRFASAIATYYIPAWIPWRMFWTYFSAATLTAGGVGLLIPTTARLAGVLTSVMIFLWCPLVHIPRTIADPGNAGEWCGIFEALAFAAFAFLLAPCAQRRASVPAPNNPRE